MTTRRMETDSDEIETTGHIPPPRAKGMRTGYTTGACATAAATAAARALLTGRAVESVVITLPIGKRVRFLVHACAVTLGEARCSVIKDGGDDPDVTHGAEVCATVRSSTAPGIELRGGEGVGTVTRPGLGLDVGGPAINPIPRQMILEHVGQALAEPGHGGLVVTISIPGGRELAKKTLNPRLGIVGGLSILGTTGIVRPYSTAAWRASVGQSIDVAAANGIAEVLMSTGGRSERYGQMLLGLEEMALIEMGEFTGYALRRAAARGIQTVHLCGMIGKFAKIAQGHLMTHVAGNQVDTAFLAKIAEDEGAPDVLVETIRAANTARHVQELAVAHGLTRLFPAICERVLDRCWQCVGGALALDVVMFDFDGPVLGRAGRPAGPGSKTPADRPRRLGTPCADYPPGGGSDLEPAT